MSRQRNAFFPRKGKDSLILSFRRTNQKRRKILSFKKRALVFILFVGIWLSGMAATQGQEKAPAQNPSKETMFAGEFERSHQQARESFFKKELKASSEAIRRAVEALSILEKKAERNREKAYMKSIEGLRKLADRVERGAVKSVKEIDLAFVQASHSLAQHHYMEGVSSWGKKEGIQAGKELKAAAAHLEEGVRWMEEKGKEETDAVVKDTRLLAGKMIEGAEVSTEETERGLKALRAEIDKLGKRIRPATKK